MVKLFSTRIDNILKEKKEKDGRTYMARTQPRGTSTEAMTTRSAWTSSLIKDLIRTRVAT